MEETLNLFNEICNSKWFINTSMILFLNKKRFISTKLLGLNDNKSVSLTTCPVFHDYKGPDQDYDSAIEYIEDKFLAQNMNPDKKVYYHITCATDTKIMTQIFESVKDIIINQAMEMF